MTVKMAGFEAMIVSAKSDLFDDKWTGRKLDKEFSSHLKDNNIDLCGENGECHTFVTGGGVPPNFSTTYNERLPAFTTGCLTSVTWFFS